MKTPLSSKLFLLSGLMLVFSNGKAQTAKKVVPQVKSNSIKVYTTAQNTAHRLSPVNDIQFRDGGAMVEKNVFVFVDDTRSFQTMLGIGGAITDASAETFAKLTPAQQTELLKAYYDPKEGIGYSLLCKP